MYPYKYLTHCVCFQIRYAQFVELYKVGSGKYAGTEPKGT